MLMDGGATLMNPTEVLVQKAISMGYAPENINVVSLGTGEFISELQMGDKEANDLLYWPSKHQKTLGIDDLPYTQVKTVDQKMEALLKSNYVRL